MVGVVGVRPNTLLYCIHSDCFQLTPTGRSVYQYLMYFQTGPGKPCICRPLLYILRPRLFPKKKQFCPSYCSVYCSVYYSVMEEVGGNGEEEYDEEEGVQPRTGKKDALGKDPGKATRSHMSN